MTQVSDTIAYHTSTNPNGVARILIVDDEQYMCDVCSRTLRSAHYDVAATTDATVALRFLRDEQPFDLLLVDIKMPGLSGLELAKQAREINPSIAIIIMTGHASMENLHQAVRRGVADFLSKPFELEQLRLAVDQALHKRLLVQDNLRLRAVEQLLHSSEALNATLERTQLRQIILQTALQQCPCTAGFLLAIDPSQQLVEPLASSGNWVLSTDGHEVAVQAYLSGQVQRIEGQCVVCSDGVQQIARGLAMPLRAQGEVVGVLLLCGEQPDVLRPGTQETVTLLANQAGTALRNADLYGRLEEAYQRLQGLDRLKSEFIAIASHELRTPLSIILGYAMMVRDQSEGEQREYVQRVLDSAQCIKGVVDDMVNLRHLELHETTVTLEWCDMHSLIDQTIKQMLSAAQAKGHTLIVQPPAAPLRLQVDREKLVMVLQNLVSNAVKFTPQNGTISISAEVWPRSRALQAARSAVVPFKTAPITSDVAGERAIVVQIRDNGIGIPENEQPHIFERFYQVANSLTRAQGGTGLGLAMVRDLIELQGGTVWVESVVGEGSTFSFALPYRSPA